MVTLGVTFSPVERTAVCLCLYRYTEIQIEGMKIPWLESASQLYRQSDRSLSTKLVPTFVGGRYHVVSVTDPYGSILGFLDDSRYFFFQVAPHLYS
jgi:hypothetical protein